MSECNPTTTGNNYSPITAFCLVTFYLWNSGKLSHLEFKIYSEHFETMKALLNSFVFLLIFLINVLSAALVDDDFIDEDFFEIR